MTKDIKFYKGDPVPNLYANKNDYQVFFMVYVQHGDDWEFEEVGPVITKDSWARSFETDTTKYFHITEESGMAWD